VESPLGGPDDEDRYWIKIGPFNQSQTVSTVDFVMHYSDETWDNNNGADYAITIKGGTMDDIGGSDMVGDGESQAEEGGKGGCNCNVGVLHGEAEAPLLILAILLGLCFLRLRRE
jgi:hypothetical protein